MNKREFLAAACGMAALSGAAHAKPSPSAPSGPALLTVSGAISKPNRGPLDPVFELLMKKHSIEFDKAHAFDFTALAALPAVTIKPTLEYDAKPHALTGPLLTDVLKAAGAATDGKIELIMCSIDGYRSALSLDKVRAARFIVATHLDGKPMPLGGLGPLWAVCDADRVPEFAAKPLATRFAGCPWALYHIDVKRG